jgi:hypothetical protein
MIFNFLSFICTFCGVQDSAQQSNVAYHALLVRDATSGRLLRCKRAILKKIIEMFAKRTEMKYADEGLLQ